MAKEIEALIQGYERFRKKYFKSPSSTFEDLVRLGQRPKILMIACSDSRVDPAIVMKCQPGDLFVIRNVANLVPPYEDDQSYHGTSAALQFGVCSLGIRHVILFGHTRCGGIQSLLEQTPEACEQRGFVAKWMELAKPAYDTVFKHHSQETFQKKATLCGQFSLMNSLKNLETFPWIRERVKKGRVFLHAWNFDLEKGILEVFDKKEQSFKEIRTEKNFRELSNASCF